MIIRIQIQKYTTHLHVIQTGQVNQRNKMSGLQRDLIQQEMKKAGYLGRVKGT